MKVEAKRPEPKFEPVTLSLTLESQREVAVLYALFDMPSLCHVLRDLGMEPADVRRPLTYFIGQEPLTPIREELNKAVT